MDADLPYVVAPGRFPDLLAKLQTAAVPDRLTHEFLKKLGFTSSNDRAYPNFLKRLGFLDQNAVPTERYRAYKHRQNAPRVLAESIRETYAELFTLDTDIHGRTRDELRDAISRVSGKDEALVDRIAGTFIMLAKIADFGGPPTPAGAPVEPEPEKKAAKPIKRELEHVERPLEFRYNIEIHLPATTDIAVYNAIFLSIREHLGD